MPAFFATRYIARMLGMAIVGWFFGALTALLLALLTSQVGLDPFAASHIPASIRPLAIAGAIWGAYGGWLLGVAFASQWFKKDWLATHPRPLSD